MILLLAGLTAVVLSPLLMREIDELHGLDWSEPANVGQTYEAVAALLTQAELARIAFDYPELVRADGSVPDRYSVVQGREAILINLSMNKWLSLFEIGPISAAELRSLVRQLFGRAESRDWWTWARDSYAATATGVLFGRLIERYDLPLKPRRRGH